MVPRGGGKAPGCHPRSADALIRKCRKGLDAPRGRRGPKEADEQREASGLPFLLRVGAMLGMGGGEVRRADLGAPLFRAAGYAGLQSGCWRFPAADPEVGVPGQSGDWRSRERRDVSGGREGECTCALPSLERGRPRPQEAKQAFGAGAWPGGGPMSGRGGGEDWGAILGVGDTSPAEFLHGRCSKIALTNDWIMLGYQKTLFLQEKKCVKRHHFKAKKMPVRGFARWSKSLVLDFIPTHPRKIM